MFIVFRLVFQVQLRMKEARAQLNTALLTNATLTDKLSKADAVNAALKDQVWTLLDTNLCI
jgi:hypothetical protein